MGIKVADYIVDFLISKGVTDTFGYPGGSVTNLVNSLHEREEIKSHVVYHEQAAAFAATAYAQASGNVGVAYATGGPGATNLITGIGHAYYDSLPIICFTGNVNTFEAKGAYRMRQRSFQESDIISVVEPLTKYCAYVESSEKISYYLEKAYYMAVNGRKGPVLLDFPMNILREYVDETTLVHFEPPTQDSADVSKNFKDAVLSALNESKRPCFILGNAIKTEQVEHLAHRAIDRLNIPYVTSMIAFDVLGKHRLNYGFLGAYGSRAANFIMSKCDLIISLGSRLDNRQVGHKRDRFAAIAKIIRVDIDETELEYKLHADEEDYQMSVNEAIEIISDIEIDKEWDEWIALCDTLKGELSGLDDLLPTRLMREVSMIIPQKATITTDVGQNQVWVAQAFELKKEQKVLFCGGMGAMGYALPASIGAYYGFQKKYLPICICGDGGLQMNIQELQFVIREGIPIKIIVFNNKSLGMIRHFQEMYFDKKYYETTKEYGYTVPDFCAIARAYGMESTRVNDIDEIKGLEQQMMNEKPVLVEIAIEGDTYISPKLEYGKENQDQSPMIDRDLYERLNSL